MLNKTWNGICIDNFDNRIFYSKNCVTGYQKKKNEVSTLILISVKPCEALIWFILMCLIVIYQTLIVDFIQIHSRAQASFNRMKNYVFRTSDQHHLFYNCYSVGLALELPPGDCRC